MMTLRVAGHSQIRRVGSLDGIQVQVYTPRMRVFVDDLSSLRDVASKQPPALNRLADMMAHKIDHIVLTF